MHTFTIPQVMEKLSITNSQAYAAIMQGLREDKIRVIKEFKDFGGKGVTRSVYQLNSWSREWVVKPWGSS